MESFLWYGSFVGIFAIIDSLFEHQLRLKLGEYIFGFHQLRLRDFETSLITGILGLFLKGTNRIRVFRVFVFSIVASPFVFIFTLAITVEGMALFQGNEFGSSEGFGTMVPALKEGWTSARWQFALGFLMIGICSFVGDIWNVFVGKIIYFGNMRLPVWVAFMLDAAVSVLPFWFLTDAAIGWLSVTVDKIGDVSNTDLAYMMPVVMLPIASLASVVFFFAIKLCILLVGASLHIILTATKLNRYTVLYTRAHEVPMTFIGIVIAMIMFLAEVINVR